jgi:hypothetical protein
MGFDSSLYSSYLNPSTNNVYTAVTATATGLYANRPTTKLIITPNVVTQAKAYFGCNSLTGMQL